MEERRAWLAFSVVTAVVFATIPLARRIQYAVEATTGRELFLVVVAAGIVAAAWAAARRSRRGAHGGRRSLGVLALLSLAYLAGAFVLRRNPEEAIHLLEYGALGVLGARALAFRIPGAWVYPSAALLGAAVGMIDEALQWITPSRHWDLRDLAINGLAASGVQLGLAAGAFGPPARGDSARGRRGFCAVAALAWVLLGASLLNTPSRIAAYAGAMPGLGFLLENDGVMLEYGHLHELPDLARFRSRFSREALARADQARAEEAGAVLRRLGNDADYAAFLATHNPVTDPFLHELRVHLFRRDRYRENAARHAGDPPRARRDLTVAHRENEILEAAFPKSLAASGHAWPEAERRRIGRAQAAGRPYESPVSRGLVTSVRETTVAAVWLAGFAGLAALALSARGVGRRLSSPPGAGQRG